MAKVYNYIKNGEELSVSVDEEIENYLETNKNVTGEEPSEFISFYADAYKENEIIDAIKKGIEDDSSILMMYQKFGNMAFETGDKEKEIVKQSSDDLKNQDNDMVKKSSPEAIKS